MHRRSMLGIAAATIGAVVGLVPLAAGLMVFLDPLLRKKQKPLAYRESNAGNNSMIRVATLDELPEDGIPRRFPVIADRVDAWNFTPAQRIGAVWIRRLKNAEPAKTAESQDGSDDKPAPAQPGANGEQAAAQRVVLQVFQSSCPHLGCSVDYQSDSANPEGVFLCPCHNSSFDVSGNKIDLPGQKNPSRRGMDPLEFDQARLDRDREVWIRFVNFETGVPERREIS